MGCVSHKGSMHGQVEGSQLSRAEVTRVAGDDDYGP